MMKNNMLLRTISGIIFVVLMVEMTVLSEITFYILWGLLALLCVGELAGLTRKHTPAGTSRALLNTCGIVYILAAMAATVALAYASPGGAEGDWLPSLVIMLLTVVWGNDVGAYLVGIAIGKHKMAPKISPKKSWEGFFGGLLFAVGITFAWYALFWEPTLYGTFDAGTAGASPLVMKLMWLGFGLVIALAAVAGDLLESKLKRLLNVKDSGRLIPGHGGILDRLDATLLAAIAAWLYLQLIPLV